MRRLATTAAVWWLIFAAVGCRRETARLPSSNRVVSLSPSTTEAMFAIGAGNQLVGRSRYCDYPPEARQLPEIGGYADPSLEAILVLRPGLVVGARGPAGPSFARTLEAHGARTYFPQTETFAQIEEMICGLGRLTDHRDEAQTVAAAISTRLAAITQIVDRLPPLRVVLVFDIAPIVVAGPGSLADEVMRRAGGVNAVREGGPYPVLGIEGVLALDPEFIVYTAPASGSPRIDSNTPGWSHVPAVRGGRVVALHDESIFRPGPRIAEGVAALARALHPAVDVP